MFDFGGQDHPGQARQHCQSARWQWWPISCPGQVYHPSLLASLCVHVLPSPSGSLPLLFPDFSLHILYCTIFPLIAFLTFMLAGNHFPCTLFGGLLPLFSPAYADGTPSGEQPSHLALRSRVRLTCYPPSLLAQVFQSNESTC